MAQFEVTLEDAAGRKTRRIVAALGGFDAAMQATKGIGADWYVVGCIELPRDRTKRQEAGQWGLAL